MKISSKFKQLPVALLMIIMIIIVASGEPGEFQSKG
jgi:hypothetical protein